MTHRSLFDTQNQIVIEISKIAALKCEEAQAAADTQRLVHQLSSLTNKHSAASSQQDIMRMEREEHRDLMQRRLINMNETIKLNS